MADVGYDYIRFGECVESGEADEERAQAVDVEAVFGRDGNLVTAFRKAGGDFSERFY